VRKKRDGTIDKDQRGMLYRVKCKECDMVNVREIKKRLEARRDDEAAQE